jgi:transposase-like protein
MDWKAVYGDFSDLPKSEQHSLFQAIKDTLFPEPKEDIANMVGEIREVRFSSGLACVHCGSVNNKRNGKYRSRQRYICKGCGKSFNDMTANPDFRNHYPHKWLKYFQMMVDGVTLPKIAEELEIHVSTALYWRYKILIALRSIGFSTLKGIIESDETYFLESDKGKKSVTNRKPRERGGKAKKRGISKEQISVVVAHDRNGNVLSKVAGRGRTTADEIDQTLNGCLEKEVVLCTDSATNYKAFARQKGIPHYLSWFRFLELHKQLNKNLRKRTMVLKPCKKANFITVGMFKTG